MREECFDRNEVSVIAFCRFLRENGLDVDIRRTLMALETVRAVGVADQAIFASALRAALCSSEDDWKLFKRLFDAFWHGEHRTDERLFAPSVPQSTSSTLWVGVSDNTKAFAEGENKTTGGASSERKVRTVDFSLVPQQDLDTLERLSRRLLRRMSLRLSRRKIAKEPGQIDLRRTIRKNIRYGGNPIVLARRARKPRRNNLVILLDISGSMNAYSLFLLRFAYALQRSFRRVDTFLFSTELVEITRLIRSQHVSEAFKKISDEAAGWSGGTRIGESLRELNRDHRNSLHFDTVFIILSDGWDTGDPGVLAAELKAVRRRIEKIIWLNPLLGMPDYKPLTRAMAAALAHVDVFAPAHNLESLLLLERFL